MVSTVHTWEPKEPRRLGGKLGWAQHSKSWNSLEIGLRVQKIWKPGAEPTCTVYLSRKVLRFSLIMLRTFLCVTISIYHFGDWDFFVWVNFYSQIEDIKLGWIQGLHIFPYQLLTCFVICLIDGWELVDNFDAIPYWKKESENLVLVFKSLVSCTS